MSFDPMAAAVDWLDVYRACETDALLGIHAEISFGREEDAMSYSEELRKGSPLHRVTTIDDRTFSIEPVDEGLSDLAAFQRVARDTVRHEGEDGYRITLQNLTGSIYDLLVLKRD
ncbi:hypothetical protein [Bradyrhizobium sp. 6(2017)]|uniref:hypothetical protein n=1 Tax=Bradyrhizobium sp. 6(2017) TaxID=1197460 RepID=UPI001FEF2406|nr:hypothetical protein [Bradyrhizobium sp. 6(2017)]